MDKGIVIIDFGSQYNKLIARRIREADVYAEVVPCTMPLEEILSKNPVGIILSGGPSSVLQENAFVIDKAVYEQGIPVLGICYGMQLMAHQLGGKVQKGVKGEYGRSQFHINYKSSLFHNIPQKFDVWMSHFDEVAATPEDFVVIGKSGIEIAAMQNEDKKLYAVQFHPEVYHTQHGTEILHNFVFNICQAEKNWKLENFVEHQIAKIREQVGDKNVILGLSGGVDSSVAGVLLQQAIGEQLTCIFVDTGLLRKDEAAQVMETYGKEMNMNIVHVDAKEDFMQALSGISDPEEKRKIIGRRFIEIFDREAEKLDNVDFLSQGTIYPDVIESQSVKGPSATIKSHHNVGGLPEYMKLQLVEPLRELFKDEVRQVGEALGISKTQVMRHPFPGPGLGIRILGEVNAEKIEILQNADAIFIEELRNAGWYEKVSQAFVVLLPVKSVGVMGDERTYAYTAVIRSADTTDFMTATWSRLPYDLLDKISSRIINEVPGINRVAYDISSKPPATIEWE
ncbi:MAG: glutamine-hydrolyzing GMP synthase [Weeksellaceae bacterium]|nr:glutamine-hydrolyzing GMP synthase [Weeksellaceae bacterium]